MSVSERFRKALAADSAYQMQVPSPVLEALATQGTVPAEDMDALAAWLEKYNRVPAILLGHAPDTEDSRAIMAELNVPSTAWRVIRSLAARYHKPPEHVLNMPAPEEEDPTVSRPGVAPNR